MRKRKAPIVEDDPILAEVRQWKAEVWEEGGGTVEGHFRRMRELMKTIPPHRIIDRSGKVIPPYPSDITPYPGDEPES